VLPRKKDCTESSWPVKWPCARRHCQGTVSGWPGDWVQPSVNRVCFLSKLCILNLEISFSVLQIARGRWMLVATSLGSLLSVFVSSQPSKSRKTCWSFFWMPVLCWIPQELFGPCSWLGSHTNCMARFGLLAGVATAALGALCSYEARVLHLHSVVPGDTFQVWILPCVLFAVSGVFYFGFITPHQKSLLCAPEFYGFSMNTVPGMLRKILTIWFGLVFVYQQFTEVLGCDDACPGSQCSQIQKMSAEERASGEPRILGFQHNGLNSYETLIFAPRYWAWAIGGDLNSFMGPCANWFGDLKAWKNWGSGKDFGESCYSLCWRYLLPSITYSLCNYQLTCWWAIATFLLLVTPPEFVYRFERIIKPTSCELNSASQFDLASELPMVNQENLAWTGILEWKRLEISRMLCLSVFCLIHLKIICLCNQWTEKDIGTGIHCLCSEYF